MITQSQLRELLSYDEETGEFVWKINVGCKIRAGKVAGRSANGYVKIGIGGKAYFAHRLVWLYVHGHLPVNEIDHINRIKNDNRLCNLRDVSHKHNSENRDVRSDSSTGSTGVYMTKNDKWYAQVYSNQERFYLGVFETKEAAELAYLNKASELFTHPNL